MRLPLLKVKRFMSDEVIPCSFRLEANLDFGSLCPGRDVLVSQNFLSENYKFLIGNKILLCSILCFC